MKRLGLLLLLVLLVGCGSEENTPQLEAGNRNLGVTKAASNGATSTPAPTQPTPLIAFESGETAVVLTNTLVDLKTQLEDDYLPIVMAEIDDRDTALSAMAEHNAYMVIWAEGENDQTTVYIETIASSDNGRFFIPSYEMTSFVIDTPDAVSQLYDFTIGVLFYLKQSYIRALFAFDKVEGTSDVLVYMRGMSYFKDREFEQAVLEYENALAINPDLYAAYCNRALARMQLSRNEENMPAILADLNQATTLEPNNPYAFALRGQLYMFAGDQESALTDFLEYEYLAGDDADPRVLAAIEEITAPPPSPTPAPIPFQNPSFPDGMVFRLAASMPIMPLKVEPGVFRDVGLCLNTYDITVLQSVEHFTGIWIQVECEGQTGWMREVEIRLQ